LPFFRCYGLDDHGRIAASDEFDQPDLAAALQAGREFVARCSPQQTVVGFEIWQGSELLFSTHPPDLGRSA
jgi:hypothetical protein